MAIGALTAEAMAAAPMAGTARSAPMKESVAAPPPPPLGGATLAFQLRLAGYAINLVRWQSLSLVSYEEAFLLPHPLPGTGPSSSPRIEALRGTSKR